MSVSLAGTPTTGVFTSGTGLSVTPAAGSNRALVLALAHSSSSGNGVPTVYAAPTYNGASMVQIGALVTNSTVRYQCCTLWYLLEANLPTSAQTLLASWNATSNSLNEADALACVWTLAGVNQTTPVTGSDSGNTNSGTSISGSGLSATTGGFVVFNCSFGPDSSGTTPSGYTQDFLNIFDFSGEAMMGHKAIATGGTETPVVSWTGAFPASIITANFQQAVSDTQETPPAGSITTTGNTPTVTKPINTVISPYVARRRIFLPAWRRAA